MRISDRVRHANVRPQPIATGPESFWTRDTLAMLGVSTLAFFILLAMLLLTGCDFPRCGVMWPCID